MPWVLVQSAVDNIGDGPHRITFQIPCVCNPLVKVVRGDRVADLQSALGGESPSPSPSMTWPMSTGREPSHSSTGPNTRNSTGCHPLRLASAHAEGQGRCLDCRLVVATPFTIHAAA